MPPKKDDFEEKMSAYKRKEETEKLSSEFIDAINLTEDEKKVFESKLKDLVGDRVLTKDQMKQAMI